MMRSARRLFPFGRHRLTSGRLTLIPLISPLPVFQRWPETRLGVPPTEALFFFTTHLFRRIQIENCCQRIDTRSIILITTQSSPWQRKI